MNDSTFHYFLTLVKHNTILATATKNGTRWLLNYTATCDSMFVWHYHSTIYNSINHFLYLHCKHIIYMIKFK